MSPAILGRVLVVDDELQLMEALVEALNAQGYEAYGFSTGVAAIEALQEQEFDLLLTDLMMPGMDGITLLKACKALDPNLVGIVMTGQGTVPTAVEAMKIGSFDYVLKPFRLDVLLPVLARAREMQQLRLENIQLRAAVALYDLSQTISSSLDSQLVLEKTIEAALKQTGSEEASILLLTPDEEELYVAVVRGRDREDLLGNHMSLEAGIAGWVARQSEPLILNGEVSDPRFAPIQPRPEIRSAISMPMMTAGKLIGILNVNSLQARHPFTAGQVKALSILTSTAAAALENERLFNTLEAREKRFRALIENAPDGIALLGMDGKLRQVTPSTEQILGYTLEEAVGQDPALLTHPEDLPNLLALLSDLIQNPEKTIRAEYRFMHKDGSWRWLESTISNLISEPSVESIVFNYRDITERKRAEAELQRAKDFAENVIQTANVIFLQLDTFGNVLKLNNTAEEISGYSLDEIVGKSWFETLVPRNRYPYVWDEFIRIGQRGETTKIFENPILTKHGEERHVIWKNNVLQEDDEIIGTISFGVDITERKRAEEALRESETRFRSLIENSSDEVSIVSADGSLLYESPSANPTLGYQPGEFLHKNLFQLVHPDDLERVHRQFDELLRDPRLRPRERFRLLHNNGTWRWVEVLGTNLLDEPTVRGVVVNYHDVTERAHAEEQIRYQALIAENVLDAVVATDKQGIIKSWNKAAEGMFGYPAEEVIDQLATSVMNFEYIAVGFQEVSASLQDTGSWKGEVRVHRKDGGVVYSVASVSIIRDHMGENMGYLSVNHDITERKRAEEDLYKSELKYRNLVETSHDLIWSIDADGLITYLNQASRAIYGYEPEELIGHSFFELMDPNYYHLNLDEFKKTIANGDKFVDVESFVRHRDGRQIILSANSLVLRDDDHNVIGVIGTSRDVTERKQAEEALRESEEQYRGLFEDSPISLWVEDFSRVKQRLAQLKETGVEDIPVYLREHSDFVIECANHVQILDVNSACVKLYHARDKAELLGSLMKILPTLPVEQFERELIPLASGQLNFEREGVDQTLTGETIYVNLRWTVAPGYEDTLARVIVSTVDVTERKQAEQKIQRQLQRLRALRAIDLAISSTFDMNMSLTVLLNGTVSQLDVSAAAILLYNQPMLTLEYAAGNGFSSSAIQQTRIRLGEGFAGRAALEHNTVHIDDLAQAGSDFVRAEILKEEAFVSYYSVPLIAKGELKGVLEIFHRAELHPDQEWLDFLDTLAGQAAIAIDNGQLFEGLRRSNFELGLAYDATIEGWSRAMDLRDKETEGHTQRVTELTLNLARAMDIDAAELIHMRRGALLHDMGKLGVPDNILLKPGKLTDEEWEIMRKHPQFAYNMLSEIQYLKPALDIPYCHHEKWDGTGYPRNLKGEQIPRAARIFAVVDVWDAVTSDRPYRKAWSREEATQYIKDQSGKHFDPHVVNVFLNMIAQI